jgi:hypothetical protein
MSLLISIERKDERPSTGWVTLWRLKIGTHNISQQHHRSSHLFDLSFVVHYITQPILSVDRSSSHRQSHNKQHAIEIKSTMKLLSIVLATLMLSSTPTLAFTFLSTTRSVRSVSTAHYSSAPFDAVEAQMDDSAIQWELFNKHHAKGSWKGIWTTFDYIGDVIDETVASVDLKQSGTDKNAIEQTHNIVVGAKKSDCATCFDSMETKTIPVATYSPTNMHKSRMAASAMVNGPTLLRSGAMATELVLSYGDGRVRVVFQHAPVWARGIEPGSCPPQGLKLFRCMLSREALRSTAPTAEQEAQDPPAPGNPVFNRPVPPFDWHKKWAGTSWTWGPQIGNKGWSLDELEDMDSWHGITPPEMWNLRLPGGVFIQSPRVVTDDQAGVCRLAWLPNSETLLRVEVGVMALQPMFVEDDDDMVGFEPPRLASLRCDIMDKVGDLEGQPKFSQEETPAPEDDTAPFS